MHREEARGSGAIRRETQGGQRALAPRPATGASLCPDAKQKRVVHRAPFEAFPS